MVTTRIGDILINDPELDTIQLKIKIKQYNLETQENRSAASILTKGLSGQQSRCINQNTLLIVV